MESNASRAREATISSESCESTVSTSARSTGFRCAPAEQTASLRSRVARLCRSSSTTSGERDSTAYLPWVLRSQNHFTGGARRAVRRDQVRVQFQQQGGGFSSWDRRHDWRPGLQEIARSFLSEAMRFESSPAVNASDNQPDKQKKDGQHQR